MQEILELPPCGIWTGLVPLHAPHLVFLRVACVRVVPAMRVLPAMHGDLKLISHWLDSCVSQRPGKRCLDFDHRLHQPRQIQSHFGCMAP